MQHIYQVLNSYHLLEGLDSEFLIIAESEEQALDNCLAILTEDQDSHIEEIRKNIEDLKKSLNKSWATDNPDDPINQFIAKANDRSRENINKYVRLLESFNGYKRENLIAHRLNPRLKNGQIQYD